MLWQHYRQARAKAVCLRSLQMQPGHNPTHSSILAITLIERIMREKLVHFQQYVVVSSYLSSLFSSNSFMTFLRSFHSLHTQTNFYLYHSYHYHSRPQRPVSRTNVTSVTASTTSTRSVKTYRKLKQKHLFFSRVRINKSTFDTLHSWRGSPHADANDEFAFV